MPRSAPLRRRHLLTEKELAEGFAALSAGTWRAREARPFAKQVKAAPAVAAPYLVHRLMYGSAREQEIATALLSLVRGPRAVLPLREVLKDRGLSDGARAAAGSVLELMGEIDDWSATRSFSDAEALVAHILSEVLKRAEQDEGFREQFLASLDEDDAESRAEMLRTLAATKDRRAQKLLLPLLYNRRARTVLATVEALELLAYGEVIPALQELADGDPDPRVRQLARAAFGRLYMRVGGFTAIPSVAEESSPSLPLHKSCVTLIDQNGDQAVLVARAKGDGYLKVVTVMVNDQEGIRGCFGVDRMSVDELQQLLAQLTRNGLTPVESSITDCRTLLDEGRRKTLKKRLRLPAELEVWREVIDAPPASEPEQLALFPASGDGERLLFLVSQTGALFTTPEFRQWYLPPQAVFPYVDRWYEGSIRQQNGETGQQVLEQLLQEAATEVFDEATRALFARRLERQAQLLKRMGKDDSAQLAAAAAVGLDPARGVLLTTHPFVRGMLLSSLLNAGLRPPQPRLFPEDWD